MEVDGDTGVETDETFFVDLSSPRLSYPTISGVTIHYRTLDGSAVDRREYVAKSDQVLTFEPGEWLMYAKVKVQRGPSR